MSEETQEALDTAAESAVESSEIESPVEEPVEETQPESAEAPQPSFDFPALQMHYAALRAEAAALGLDWEAALSDPRFVRLTAPGLGVSAAAAWHALHAEEERAAQREALSRAVSAGKERPKEGGGSGAALLAADPRRLSPRGRAELKQRIFDAAARGQKIYP